MQRDGLSDKNQLDMIIIAEKNKDNFRNFEKYIMEIYLAKKYISLVFFNNYKS